MLPDVFAHVKSLCYLVNNTKNGISHDGKQLRLKKCKGDNGRWQDKYWVCNQQSGVFILFGYLGPRKTKGHFVAAHADKDIILDSLTSKQYNICITSLGTIFPGGFDCVHQLLPRRLSSTCSNTCKNNLDGGSI